MLKKKIMLKYPIEDSLIDKLESKLPPPFHDQEVENFGDILFIFQFLFEFGFDFHPIN